uniref:Uncharacterized protein n=1 Tax=Aplanochytrium stocchinoi TaxID=215587 RepID=A0A7S3LTG8_9STRA|mmetsp:Transcript_4564/g.5760  ORF Transcript_4564/g.5760 Transcript_4564/m.5760 type:complete len:400 (+) Transcript_4564:40-1239(+)
MECPACHRFSVVHYCLDCAKSVIGRFQTPMLNDLKDEKYRSQVRRLRTALKAQRKREELAELVNNFTLRLCEYRKRAEEAKIALETETKRVALKRQALQSRWERLKRARARLNNLMGLFLGNNGVAQPMLLGMTAQLEDLSEAIAMERQKKVRQLVQLFPVSMPQTLGETGVGSIASLALPTSLANLEKMKPDARTAAIATIIRVLLIASSYLSLPLPFEMKTVDGKSCIGPWKAQDDAKFMLTEPGPSLQTGMTMLCWNVEALCFNQGVPSNLILPDELLHNLWQVFHSPSLGRTIYRSLLDAERRMGRVQLGYRIKTVDDSQPEDLSYFEYVDDIKVMYDDSDDEYMDGNGPSAASGSKSRRQNEHAQGWDIVSTPHPPAPVDEDDIKHWVNAGAGV